MLQAHSKATNVNILPKVGLFLFQMETMKRNIDNSEVKIPRYYQVISSSLDDVVCISLNEVIDEVAKVNHQKGVKLHINPKYVDYYAFTFEKPEFTETLTLTK